MRVGIAYMCPARGKRECRCEEVRGPGCAFGIPDVWMNCAGSDCRCMSPECMSVVGGDSDPWCARTGCDALGNGAGAALVSSSDTCGNSVVLACGVSVGVLWVVIGREGLYLDAEEPYTMEFACAAM